MSRKRYIPRVSEAPGFNVPLEQSLDGTLGFEMLEVGDDHARSRARVGNHLKQPYGLVHGGVYAAMAESLASIATAMAVQPDGNIAVGLSNHTSFMRPVIDGHVNAAARRVHRGSTTWVWEVELSDDEGRLCALSRVTMAVRPAASR
jgi:1,4-dihydroxy-2-naphthoyl-CoA hydrolase